uniref:Translin family protein n=1 Tax=Kalanchoe fedtschenkoi TaxID=63787 RepID=A0A7N0R9E4_KALFE
MKSAFRTAFYFTLTRSSSSSQNPNSFPISAAINRFRTTTTTLPSPSPMSSQRSFSSTASLEKQFDDFRQQLDASGSLRDRIKAVVVDIESATRLIHANLLLVHQSRPIPEVLEKAKTHIDVLKGLYRNLAAIMGECPGEYYRYQGEWRSETQTVVSLLAYMHWLETGNLLLHNEAEGKLELDPAGFGLDIEEYLIGICFMSNELPRYVVNQVTTGDYDCPRKVLKFLTDLHAAFRMLNLRNDFLRKKFDGMKYDLRKVEEVYYDVKIRGLAVTGDTDGQQQGA